MDREKCTVTIQRTLKAPIQLVWEAWTQGHHITNWWGPKGTSLQIEEHDFRVGGKWRYSMVMPNGQEFITEGIYKEIIEPTKLVTTADFRPMTEGVVLEVILKATGDDETEFIFNVIHPSEEYKIQQEKMGIYNGWGSVFDQLEDFLQEQQKE